MQIRVSGRSYRNFLFVFVKKFAYYFQQTKPLWTKITNGKLCKFNEASEVVWILLRWHVKHSCQMLPASLSTNLHHLKSSSFSYSLCLHTLNKQCWIWKWMDQMSLNWNSSKHGVCNKITPPHFSQFPDCYGSITLIQYYSNQPALFRATKIVKKIILISPLTLHIA